MSSLGKSRIAWNELVWWLLWPLYHSVPSSPEMTLKWMLSTLWMFYSLNSDRRRPLFRKTNKQRNYFERKRFGLILPQERQVSPLYCFRFRKGQNPDEKDIFSPFSLNIAWHGFISIMYNLKLPRERNEFYQSLFLVSPTMKSTLFILKHLKNT